MLWRFCTRFVEMHLTVVGGCQIFVFGLFYNIFHDFLNVEGPNGSIFCILYLFYKCFAKIDVRVCGRFPVFENLFFFMCFWWFRIHWFIIVLYMFCETLLADVEFSFVGLFYKVFDDFCVLQLSILRICCILYLFCNCLAKIYVRVCGRFPVFENLLFYEVFLIISNFVVFILVL